MESDRRSRQYLLPINHSTAPNNRCRQQTQKPGEAVVIYSGRTITVPSRNSQTCSLASNTMTDKVCGTGSKVAASPSPLEKRSHPLDPLDPAEVPYRPPREQEATIADPPQIVAASRAVQLYAAEKLSVKALRFIVCNLLPPPKKQVLAYLGIPLVTGQKPDPHPGELPRKAEVDVSVSPKYLLLQDPRLTFGVVHRSADWVCNLLRIIILYIDPGSFPATHTT